VAAIRFDTKRTKTTKDTKIVAIFVLGWRWPLGGLGRLGGSS
jgi:hypothetical protein